MTEIAARNIVIATGSEARSLPGYAVDEQQGEILGVHTIGTGVTENIHEAVVAMGLEGTVADPVHAVHAHPTLAEGMHGTLESVFGSAIHI